MKLNEAEARFTTIDPIIKAILELTGCRVKLEETVRASDIESFDSDESMSDVSDRSTSDYVIYHITFNQAVNIIGGGKNRHNFIKGQYHSSNWLFYGK